MYTDLIKLRHKLHSKAELSGYESNTVQIIGKFLAHCKPDKIITGIGGHGLAVIFDGEQKGPVILLRCELDALPIPETIDIEYGSQNDGVAHKCGHDGHMAILAGVAKQLSENKPSAGKVILMYQPAEETGKGAAHVIDDRHFSDIKPDYAIALHNLPGYEFGTVVINDNVFASASTGIKISLHGKTAHAGEPEKGISPALAVAGLIQTLSALPQSVTSLHENALITIIHARIGEVAFGTSPGEGQVMATLRAYDQKVIERLIDKIKRLVSSTANVYDLRFEIEIVEPFPPTVNDENVVKAITRAAETKTMKIIRPKVPFPWSEDFGHFTSNYKGALFGLGSGVDQPNLHHPEYDFPDELIKPGVELLKEIIKQIQVGHHV